MSNKYIEKKIDDNEKENELIRKQLQDQYEHDWQPCEQILPLRNSIDDYLGDTDADDEWNNDPEGACQRFLNIEAYSKFKENDKIILIGRTGTGKSSMLNRYKYAVENGEINQFKTVINIKFQDIFDKLATYDFVDERNSIHYLKDIIEIVIRLSIIHKFVGVIEENESDKEKIKTILKDLNIGINSDIVEHIYDDLDEKFDTSNNLREIVVHLKKIYKDIFSDELTQIIKDALDGKKIVVLADSLDYYDIVERKIVLINQALVDIAFEYYRNLKNNRILLKIALPSEVYTHILERIVAKRKGKIVTIEWRYKDIVKMLAIKIFYFFKSSGYNFATSFIENYSIEDFYEYESAIDFLHTMLPEKCGACIPVQFDTIPYCIRHTQKKPRQILQVFNALIEKICEERQFMYFKYKSHLVRFYVHRSQSSIIEDALNMYNSVLKDSVLTIASSVFSNKRNFMNAKEFGDAVKDATKIYTALELSKEDIENILIESGLVGLLTDEHFIKENNPHFQNKNVTKISTVLFEYQRKDMLPRKSDAIYVLHPMCYEYYANEIDNNALVYPAPADDLEDNIIEKLKNQHYIY